MGKITLELAASWCGGRIDPQYADRTFCGANIDSRKVKAGELFVALLGARDGHDYIPMALEHGAAAVLCSRCEGDYPAIVVDDTRKALGDIARGYREHLAMKVVGVTGSVGKSTTKEMIACILGAAYRTGKSAANFNNDLGLPMSVLALPEDTEVAVLEMGMNHFREIAYLSSIAKPDVAAIVNIGTMHIEHLGSQEGILRAKLEILEGMKPDGKLVLNGDDPLLWRESHILDVETTCCGYQNRDCQVFATDVFEDDQGIRFTVHNGEITFPVELNVAGVHHVSDALVAIGVALELGVAPDTVRMSLAGFRNMEGRQEIYQVKGFTIIKDCYNAGPESMAAALTVLGNRPGRHVAVLGDMLELGHCAQAEHYRIGRIAAEKTQVLLAYGPNSSRIISGARTGGMSETVAKSFDNREALVSVLKRLARPGDTILFKGSHGMHMELALELFLKDDT